MRKTMVALLWCVACREPTQITLEITTDVPCDSLSDVAITTGATTVDAEGRPVTVVTSRCDKSTGRIGSLVIVPSGSVDDAVAITVTGRVTKPGDPPAGPCVAPYGPSCIVLRRFLKYVPHTRLTMPVSLARSCAGLPCLPDETCDQGACRPVGDCGASGCASPDGGTPPVLVPGCGDMRGLQVGAQWPMLGYCPTRISRSPFNGPQSSGPVLVSAPLPHGALTSPVIDAAGTVYVAGDDALVALNPDLTVKWTQPIKGPTQNLQTDTSPVIAADGTVWVGSSTQDLWAVRQGAAKAYSVGFYFGSPVIEPSGALVFPSGVGGALHGVDAAGNVLFDLPVAATLHTVPARGLDGSIFVGTTGQKMVTMRPSRTLAIADVGAAYSDFETPLVHPSGLVLATVGGGQSAHLAAFDAAGKFVWIVDLQSPAGGSNGAAVGPDGLVYASTGDGVTTVNVLTQQVTPLPPLSTFRASTRTPSIGADGMVYVAKADTLYAVDALGNQVFSVTPGPILGSSPAIGKNGWLYFTDATTSVYGIHDP